MRFRSCEENKSNERPFFSLGEDKGKVKKGKIMWIEKKGEYFVKIQL